MHRVSYFYQKFRALRNPQIDARAETDKADALALANDVLRLFPGHDAASDQAGDLLELDVSGRSGQGKNVLFVLRGGVGVPGGEKFSGAIVEFGDDAGGRRPVDVNVPDGQEDTDARTGAAGILLVGDDDNTAIGGRYDREGIFGDCALGIAKEGKAKKSKSGQE